MIFVETELAKYHREQQAHSQAPRVSDKNLRLGTKCNGSTSVTEPVELKLFEIWSRRRRRNYLLNIFTEVSMEDARMKKF